MSSHMHKSFARCQKIKKKYFDLSKLDQMLDDLADKNSALLKRKHRNHRLKGR